MNTPYVVSGTASSAAPLTVDFENHSSDAWTGTGSKGYSAHGYVANQGASVVDVYLTDRHNVTRVIPLIGYSSQPWDWEVVKVRVVGRSTSAVPVVVGAR